MIPFYDTCSLLNLNVDAFKGGQIFYISDITLKEIEKIKNDKFKDINIKYKARLLGKMIIQHPECIKIIFYNYDWEDELKDKYHIMPNDDARILVSAVHEGRFDTFITSDVNCYILAKEVFCLNVKYVDKPLEENYKGYKEIKFNDDNEMAIWYESIGKKKEDININEYIILKNKNGEVIDKYKKGTDGLLKNVSYVKFNSKHFGEIKPKDVYQQCAMDSLKNNQFTIFSGPAGSGKSLLSLSFLFDKLDKGEINKIIIFCNPVAVRNAAKLGYYPGDRLEKLLDSQIGNFLASKLGDKEGIFQLIDRGQLELLPVSDIRGYDTSGMHAGIMVTEAQNLSIDMAKLLIQRVGEDSILIFEGDTAQQVDMVEYADVNNGMQRAINIFKGEDCFGTITLPNIYRSKIAKIADKM